MKKSSTSPSVESATASTIEDPTPNKEEIFYKGNHFDEGPDWHMGNSLLNILYPSGEFDHAIQSAVNALRTATDQININKLDEVDLFFQPPIETIKSDTCYFFLRPIAITLAEIDRGLPEEAERLKQQALDWVRLIFDKAFPAGDLESERVVGLIEIAHSLCRKLDRIPYKKEVWDEARARDKKLFVVGEDTERKLLKKAGLDGLPQGRRGRK